MRVERIGFTPLKGGHHREHADVALTADGPCGDRLFGLVDRTRERVLRTVENPSLLRTVARWDAGVLSVELPSGLAEGRPRPTAEVLEVDYWGRTATVEVVDGPWSEAYSEHLGHDVVLTRPVEPGQVVYGGPVTLVTTSSLRLLSERAGRTVESARFRSTFLVDTEGLEPHVEDSWVGSELRVGDARVRVLGVVPRCAVVDLDPVTGERGAEVLRTMAAYRRAGDGVSFGVDAMVTAPGRVRRGDPVALGGA
jgi:uncharacterized protein YcbX